MHCHLVYLSMKYSDTCAIFAYLCNFPILMQYSHTYAISLYLCNIPILMQYSYPYAIFLYFHHYKRGRKYVRLNGGVCLGVLKEGSSIALFSNQPAAITMRQVDVWVAIYVINQDQAMRLWCLINEKHPHLHHREDSRIVAFHSLANNTID